MGPRVHVSGVLFLDCRCKDRFSAEFSSTGPGNGSPQFPAVAF